MNDMNYWLEAGYTIIDDRCDVKKEWFFYQKFYDVETLTGKDDVQVEGKVISPEGKETPESIKKRSRKPPKDGLCKRCGENKPINRLMLCYSCWVKVRNEEKGWKDGQPHPAGCGCDLDCRFESNGVDN